MGIPVWQPYFDENKIQRRYFGGFMVRSFDVPHDNEPCCGFIVECPNGERLLYASDFEFIRYRFRKMRIHHFLIEANYNKDYLEHEADNRCHVLRGHAELRTTIGIIESNRTDDLRTVILCHLSKENIDPAEAVSEVKKVAGNAFVDYARAGLEIELKDNMCPF